MKKFISIVLCFIGMIFIFYNSSQNGMTSEQKSYNLLYSIEKQFKVLKPLVKSTVVVDEGYERYIKDEKLNKFLRKNAHFFEYFILAGFVSLLLFSFNFKGKQAVIYILFLCLFYAVTDEFHQIFIPGRTSSVADIIVDFCGSIFGVIVFYMLYYKIYIKYNEKL